MAVTDAARKAKAEADMAEIDLAKKRAEFDEWKAESATRARQAEQNEKVSESEKAAAEAKRAQISALIPDFSQVEKGETKFEGEAPLYAGVAAHRALADVATRVAETIADVVKGKQLLITNDADLASADGTYQQMRATIDHLRSAAQALLPKPERSTGGTDRTIALLPILGAVASAIPGILSLFAARRTVQTFAATIDTMAATAAIAGRLTGATVVLDGFRLVPETQLLKDCVELQVLSTQLETLGATKPQAKELASTIESFLTAAQTTSKDNARSPLISAALFEQLHVGKKFTHVLLITGATAVSQQTIDDKPMWLTTSSACCHR